MSENGLRRLREAELFRLNPSTDGLLLLDAFSGISASRRALQLLGVSPGTHVSTEIDPLANAVVSRSFQSVRELGDIREISAESLAIALQDNPHLRHVLCEESSLSGRQWANPLREGLQGKRSSLFFELVRLLDEAVPLVLPLWAVTAGLS